MGGLAGTLVAEALIFAAFPIFVLAERVMAERGLDVTDATLRNSVVFKVVQALRHANRRRLVRMVEKQQGHVRLGAGRRDHAARRCQ